MSNVAQFLLHYQAEWVSSSSRQDSMLWRMTFACEAVLFTPIRSLLQSEILNEYMRAHIGKRHLILQVNVETKVLFSILFDFERSIQPLLKSKVSSDQAFKHGILKPRRPTREGFDCIRPYSYQDKSRQ